MQFKKLVQICLLIIVSVIMSSCSNSDSQNKDYASFVNPFVGTGEHGHTYPGATMPFGMVQLSPDTRGPNWDGSSGYHNSDKTIM